MAAHGRGATPYTDCRWSTRIVTYIHTYTQTDRQTNRQTDRQTDRQTALMFNAYHPDGKVILIAEHLLRRPLMLANELKMNAKNERVVGYV